VLAKKVLRNVLCNSLSSLISSAVGLIVTIYLARELKPGLFGIFSLAISVALLLMTFTDLGVSPTLVRYAADAYARRDFELVRGYIKSLGKVKLILSIVTSIILFALSNIISTAVFHKPALSTPIEIVSLFVLFRSLSNYVTCIFNAFNDYSANLIRAITYESSRLVSILLLVSSFAVVGAIAGFVIASFISLIALTLILIRKYGFIFGTAKKIEWRRVLRYAGYLTIGSITWTVFAYVDSIMIGILLPARDVGFYRAAYSIVIAVGSLISIPTVLLPVFVQLEGQDMKKAFDRVFKYSSILAFPFMFSLIAMDRNIINIVYGREYLPAIPALTVLSLLVLRSALGVWGPVFGAKEKPEYPVYVTTIALIINIILNYFMILQWGIVGAGVATVISNVFSWVALSLISRKLFDVFFRLEHLFKPLLSCTILYLVVEFLRPSSIAGCVMAFLAGIFAYFVVLLAIKGITVDDIKYISKIVF